MFRFVVVVKDTSPPTLYWPSTEHSRPTRALRQSASCSSAVTDAVAEVDLM